MTALAEKVRANVTVTASGCWEWNLSRTPTGYGRVSVGKQKQAYSHRVAYEEFVGKIPEGHYVLHSCDNPPCCNPEHLSTGTQADNMKDCASKGRARNGGVSGEANPRSKLTWENVKDIRSTTTTHTDEARKYNVSPSLIGLIRRGKIWQHAEAAR